MPSRRFDRILTGTALALVLGLAATADPAHRAGSKGNRSARPDAGAGQSAAAERGRRWRQTKQPARPVRARSCCPTRPICRRRPSRTLRHRRHRPHRNGPRRRTPAPAPGDARDRRNANPRAGSCTGRGRLSGSADPRCAARIRRQRAKLGRIVDRKADRTAVEAFYSSRDYEPIWVGLNGATDRARQAINHLRNADADGMDPATTRCRPSRQTQPRRARGGRNPAHRIRTRLRAPCADRPRALFARYRRHLLRAEPAGAARRAEQARFGQERRGSARQLSAAAAGLQGAAQEACRGARHQGRATLPRRSRAVRCSNCATTRRPGRPS